jgi:5-amino-6-(5-phosphoribosylamino)uracil reductase
MFSLRFEAYARRREQEALAATLPPYETVVDRVRAREASTTLDDEWTVIGNEWTEQLFDGPFYQSATAAAPDLPIVNLVFVQSREGNTIADNPQLLGGGHTDKHLIYEGLSRVHADAVLSGSITARSRSLVLSVWHPELVKLRLSLGKPRHPAQVIVTTAGDLPFDEGLMFQERELRSYLIAPSAAVSPLRVRAARVPWVEIIDAGEPLSLRRGLAQLAERGVGVVTAIGGRRTSQSLLEERTVADLYLTTSPIAAGQPQTPFYSGPELPLRLVVEKRGTGPEEGVRFEHFRVIT